MELISTTIITVMNLRLLRLASSALPIGSFAHSQGLERAHHDGVVIDEVSAEQWLREVYSAGLSRTDLPMLQVMREARLANDLDEMSRLNQLMLASRETKELWQEDMRLGLALKKLLDVDGTDVVQLEQCSLVTQWARAGVMWDIDEEATRSAYIFSWLENACLACAKLLPLGQQQVHRLMKQLFQVVESTPKEVFDERTWGPSLPGLAMLSSRHEYLENRLFLS